MRRPPSSVARLRLLSLPLTLTACLPINVASAQGSAADDTLPALTVTGTALRRIDRDTALPVTTITRTEIDRSGARSLAELLQKLPAMQGFIPATSVSGNNTGGYTSLALHNLPDRYTLVLINGQRVAPFGGQTPLGALGSVDANTLPLAMIERIEVLTDGASALYGADALAGVVNLITRRDGDANEATAGWQQAVGGARTWSLSAYKGQGDLDADGHNLALGASVTRRSALPATARSYARQSRVDFTLGGQRVRFDDSSFYTAPANTLNGNPYLLDHSACPAGHYTEGAYCLYNYAADVMLVPAQQQHNLMASYTARVADDNRWMLDALWSRNTVWSQLSPMPAVVGLPNAAPYDTTLANLGVTDDPAYVYARLTDLGPRRERHTSDLTHLAARTEGRLHGWAWQAGALESTSTLHTDIGGGLTQQGLDAAVAQGFNPLLPPGEQTPAGLQALQRQAYSGPRLSGTTTLQGLQWQASTDAMPLPAGPLRWAVGADWRQERWRYSPSAYAQGLMTDVATRSTGAYSDAQLPLDATAALVPTAASRQVWGVFSEWLAPLQREDTRRWDLGASLRHDHDNRAGSAWTGKLHTRWQPSPALMARASVGTGFRAPSLGQMTAPQQDLGRSGSHDCTAALQALATQLGATPCDPANGQTDTPTVAISNAQLKPERSQQATLGLRIEPMAGHSIGLDWWAVRIARQIGAISEDTAFANPQTSAWTTRPDGQGGTTLVRVVQPQNLGSNFVSGIDLDASVRRGSAIGLIDSQLRLTTLLRDDYRPAPGAAWTRSIGDGLGGAPSQRWRAQWRNTLVHQAWTHSLTARYQSGYDNAPVTLTVLDAQGNATSNTVQWRQHVAGTWRFDWQTLWQLNAQVQLALGIDNVFNRRPPSSLAVDAPYKAYIVGYDDRFHDALGRVWSLQARMNF